MCNFKRAKFHSVNCVPHSDFHTKCINHIQFSKLFSFGKTVFYLSRKHVIIYTSNYYYCHCYTQLISEEGEKYANKQPVFEKREHAR
jgi:hypothetical protein